MSSSAAQTSGVSFPQLHRCKWMQLRTVRSWQVTHFRCSDLNGFSSAIASMQLDAIAIGSQVERSTAATSSGLHLKTIGRFLGRRRPDRTGPNARSSDSKSIRAPGTWSPLPGSRNPARIAALCSRSGATTQISRSLPTCCNAERGKRFSPAGIFSHALDFRRPRTRCAICRP